MSELFPVFLKLQGRRVLVAGAGAVAAGRVRQLVRARARVTVISPGVNGQLARLAGARRVKLVRRKLRRSDLDSDWFAVFRATDDPAVQKMVAQAARRRRMLLNVADQPQWCNFYMPALVRRGDLTIAIGTGGGGESWTIHLGMGDGNYSNIQVKDASGIREGDVVQVDANGNITRIR